MSKIEKHNMACNSAAKKLQDICDKDPDAIFSKEHIEMISEEAKDIDSVFLRRSLAKKLIETGDYEKARSFMALEDKDLRTDCFVTLVKKGNMELAFSFLTKDELNSLKDDLDKGPHPPTEEPPAAPAAQVSSNEEPPKYEDS